MPRSIEEWVGATPDTAIPPRVRLRIFELHKGTCQTCHRKLTPADKWDLDHVVALINGGAHAELNLVPLCCWCHAVKTRLDVAAKARTARIRKRHYGIKNPSPLAKKWAWAKRIKAERARSTPS